MWRMRASIPLPRACEELYHLRLSPKPCKIHGQMQYKLSWIGLEINFLHLIMVIVFSTGPNLSLKINHT